MAKTILITGSTDGIGLEAAKRLMANGHCVLLHGRSQSKLDAVVEGLSSLTGGERIESYVADLSRLADVEDLAIALIENHKNIDVLINNAGVLRTSETLAEGGLDVRFVVNTIAPYLLTKQFMPTLSATGRVVNISSAAQSPVDLQAFLGKKRLAEMDAYAQSKLALIKWSNHLSQGRDSHQPAIISVNPGSLLASKMVREGFGIAGNDIGIGADILCRAALSDEFADASGRYFDNDSGQFAAPHPDAMSADKSKAVVETIEGILAR